LPNIGSDVLESFDIFLYLPGLIYIVATFLPKEDTCPSLFSGEQV
jgi:hypothetical protein